MTSAFAEQGLRPTLEALIAQIQKLYCEDTVPWVVGYSGGKDSTATLQLVWSAIKALPVEQRAKPVHVISTDTLVENPIVAAWVSRSLEVMNNAADDHRMPIRAHRLTPDVKDTFWVNLIGKGYPAPRPKFRWCTERMKIKPSNAFIRGVVQENGEAILVLGIRKAESQARARSMARQETQRVRDQLSPNASLPNSLVFSPIEDWTNDDVWTFLMQQPNPWGYDNKDLLTMYQGASADGECPLVVDSSTPSCGDSRFGCWTCTLVDKDKSMHAMIQNDEEKEWMLPLLRLRDKLDVTDDKPLRDFRRLNGTVQLFHDRPIHGPYTQASRETWLRELLQAQRWIQENGPEQVRDLELISLAELEEIRRIWIIDKHEFEDRLPVIYEETLLAHYPGRDLDTSLPLGRDELELLEDICGEDRIHYEMVRELLDVERRHRAMVRRAGLFDQLEGALKRGFYSDKDDAIERARMHRDLKSAPAQPSGADAPTPIDDYFQVVEVASSVEEAS
ncbi:MAG: DNA phosphorothioation system sulfurtransferase DndC [Solirubrobacteraceae bacterium MAG38_C4-C5]|nr:DNA phosphorothioation system sulfurtransferase DndC [Candidatus Siliceabacter maunaloa]